MLSRFFSSIRTYCTYARQTVFFAFHAQRRTILSILFLVLGSMMIGIGMEWYTYQRQYHREPTFIAQESLTKNGCATDNNSHIESLSDCTIVIPSMEETPIHTVTIHTATPMRTDPRISYATPQGETITFTHTLPEKIKKTKTPIASTTLTFPVQTVPKNLTITIPDPNARITGVTLVHTQPFRRIVAGFWTACSIVAGGLMLYRASITKHPEHLFAVIALTCGALLIAASPHAYTSWDEFIHYKNADALTLTRFFPKKINDAYAHSNTIPFSWNTTEQNAIDTAISTDVRAKKSHKKSASYNIVTITELYKNISYFPSAIGLLTGRLFGLSHATIFAVGKYANLVFFVMIVFYAIRTLPFAKMLMAIIALMPTSLFLATHYSYDPWITGWFMLGTALLLRQLAAQKPIHTLRVAIAPCVAFVIGLAPKAIYFPILAVLFFLPRARFSTVALYRRYLLVIVGAILFVITTFLVPFFAMREHYSDHRGGAGIDAGAQTHYIITHPVTYTHTLAAFLLDYLHPLQMHAMVVSFAYLDAIDGFSIVLALVAFLALFDGAYTAHPLYRWQLRIAFFTIFLCTMALIATALYISFTSVGNTTIAGVQSRYILPFAFIVCALCGTQFMTKIATRSRAVWSLAVFGIIAVVILSGIWHALITRWY